MSGTNHSGQPFDASSRSDGSQVEKTPPGGGPAQQAKHRSQATGLNENDSSQATGLNENDSSQATGLNENDSSQATGLNENGSSQATGLNKDGEQTVISQKSQLVQAESTGLPPQLDPSRLGPGDSLGHYELIEFVGGGGMGRVFRALDTKLDRYVAIKVLPCEQVADPETLQRFRNEAKSAARLDHDNIARAYDIGEDRGLSYLVFEFVEGTTIRDLVTRHGPMTLADSLSYTLQAADALSHAAGRGVVHRDVKPSNILITNDGRAKLIDMGLARIQAPHDSSDDLTATGVTLGTFDYISPEQARDPRTVDVRSDIYSLGCTFFYMLTGRPPFPEGTVLQKLLQHQGDEPPNIQEFRPEMPDELSEVFGKLLAKDPKHRYQTPEELIEHLQLLAARMGLRPLGPGQRSWIAAKRRRASFFQRHLPWMAPIGSLVVIWFFLHIYWTSTAQPPPPLLKAPLQSSDDAVAAEVEQIPQIGSTNSDDETMEQISPNGVPSMVHLPKVPSGPARPKHAAPPDETKTNPLDPLSPLGEFGGPEFYFDGLSLDEPFADSWPAAKPDTKLPPVRPSGVVRPSGTVKPPEGSAALPTTADVPATGPPSSLAGVLIVDTIGKLPGTYSTLRAACNAAESGDIIELRYNGRREEIPLILGNVKFTIRAGEQFRPVIVFRPDPSKYSRSMFSLNGTRLTLWNLAVELDVLRAVPADEWSLFELGRAETVQLRKCSLTIRNALKMPQAYHENVAFFMIHADAADTALIEKSKKEGVKKSAQIELLDCIARGEAVLLRTKKLQPAHLTWKNGLLVTSEQMLDAEGAQQAPLPDDKIEIEIQHLTAIVNGGLCRIGSGHSISYQLPVSINCTDSIICSSLNRPLVEQIGGRGTSELQKLFSYNGDRNCYRYQDFNIFWSIDDNDPSTEPELIEWEAWQTRWAPDNERNSLWCRIDWKCLPKPSRLPHTLTQWDYELSESAENPAHSAASDGSDIGFSPRQLPLLPSETKSSIKDKAGGL